nr:hypothetical protein [Bacteroidota bacterium]
MEAMEKYIFGLVEKEPLGNQIAEMTLNTVGVLILLRQLSTLVSLLIQHWRM